METIKKWLKDRGVITPELEDKWKVEFDNQSLTGWMDFAEEESEEALQELVIEEREVPLYPAARNN